jgi:hypothetical protein
MVNIGGSQDPFQGSSAMDFKKTATEIQVLQSNAVSRVQEAVEHIGNCGVGPILERLAFMAAHLYQGPITVRIDNPKSAPVVPGQEPGPQDIQDQAAQQGLAQPANGPHFREIDLSILATGEFTIELTGVNSAQSKGAEAQLLMELIQMIAKNPEGALMAEGPMEKMAVLNGFKEFPEVFSTFKDRYESMKQIQQQLAQGQQMQQLIQALEKKVAELQAQLQGQGPENQTPPQGPMPPQAPGRVA